MAFLPKSDVSQVDALIGFMRTIGDGTALHEEMAAAADIEAAAVPALVDRANRRLAKVDGNGARMVSVRGVGYRWATAGEKLAEVGARHRRVLGQHRRATQAIGAAFRSPDATAAQLRAAQDLQILEAANLRHARAEARNVRRLVPESSPVLPEVPE